jgi:hypothetical protein
MEQLIPIQTDVWRYDCIAGIGVSEDGDPPEFIIQIFPLNSAEYIAYFYNSRDELYAAYHHLLQQWKEALSVSL